MGQISQFLRRFNCGIAHYCPACRELHRFWIDQPNYHNGAKWDWDGNIIEPTMSPSMHIMLKDPQNEIPDEVCHYFLKQGKIHFQPDCTHEWKGLIVNLPPLPDHLRDQCLDY